MRICREMSVLAVLVLNACGPVEATPQETDIATNAVDMISQSPADALSDFLELNARTENIAYRILRANVEACPQTAPQIGISVHTILDYPEDIKDLATEKFGVGDLPQIRHVVSGSAAEKAGLRTGDVIESIGNHSMIGGQSARQFYEGVYQLEFGLGESKLNFRRENKAATVSVTPERLCGYDVEIEFADYINAYTDGEGIWLTSKLVSATNKDISLALIFAHELAHATQGHMFKEPSKGLEVEADFLGMQYLISAGYDGEEALAEWTANPFNHAQRAELTHPSPTDRIAAMQRAILLAK